MSAASEYHARRWREHGAPLPDRWYVHKSGPWWVVDAPTHEEAIPWLAFTEQDSAVIYAMWKQSWEGQ